MDVAYELSSKRVERNVLQAELEAEELWDSDEFQRLEKQIGELETRLDAEKGTQSESGDAISQSA